VVLTSRKNVWIQIFIFPLRYYANCMFTMLTVLITLKMSTSFIVTLYCVMRTLLNLLCSLEPPDWLRDLPAFYEDVIMALPQHQSGCSVNISIYVYLVSILRMCGEIPRLSHTVPRHGTVHNPTFKFSWLLHLQPGLTLKALHFSTHCIYVTLCFLQ
jgi:hypothetical protein